MCERARHVRQACDGARRPGTSAHLHAMADRMVVSDMGEMWSPKTEPERMDAMTDSMRSSSSGAAANAALVATGNRIAIVPQDVPASRLCLSELLCCRAACEQPYSTAARLIVKCMMLRTVRSGVQRRQRRRSVLLLYRGAPVAREMQAPRKKTRVESARLSMADEMPDAMKSSVPSSWKQAYQGIKKRTECYILGVASSATHQQAGRKVQQLCAGSAAA